MEALEEAVGLDPRDSAAWSEMGAALMMLGRNREALEVLEKAMRFDPLDAKAAFNRGIALANLGDLGQAIQAFDRATEIDRSDGLAWRNKGVALLLLERHQEAIQAFEEAIRIEPQNAAAWSNLGCVLALLERHHEALQAFDEATRLGLADAVMWVSQGMTLGALGRWQESLQVFDRAIDLDAGNGAAWQGKGTALLRLAKYRKALHALDRVIVIDPADASAWSDKGVAYLQLERYVEAQAAFEKAIALSTGEAAAWEGKAQALYHLSLIYEDAARLVEQAFLKRYGHRLMSGGATTLLRLRRSGAAEVLPGAMGTALDGGDRESEEETAASRGKHEASYLPDFIHEADQAIEMALAQDQWNASFLNTRGAIQLRQGRHEDAIRLFEEAGQKRSDRRFMINRAVALARLHRSREADAEEALQKAMDALSDAQDWQLTKGEKPNVRRLVGSGGRPEPAISWPRISRGAGPAAWARTVFGALLLPVLLPSNLAVHMMHRLGPREVDLPLILLTPEREPGGIVTSDPTFDRPRSQAIT